jgi:hypothetical protein
MLLDPNSIYEVVLLFRHKFKYTSMYTYFYKQVKKEHFSCEKQMKLGHMWNVIL